MAINFPSTPTIGETYTSGNTTWEWDGESWSVTNLIDNFIASRFTSTVSVGTAPLTVTSTTQVANLNVATAGSATTAGTVTTAAQPNITSVGTLSSLEVTGNVTASQLISNVTTGTAPFTVSSTTQVANLNAATAGSATTAGTVTTAAQPNITSVGSLSSLTVTGTTNLGAVGNVTITGGTNGYVLSTDGTGVLSWIPAASASTGNVTFSVATVSTTGTNEDLTLDPNGTGNVVVNSRLYVNSNSTPLVLSGIAPFVTYDETDTTQQFFTGVDSSKFWIRQGTTANADLFTVLANGNVGIGTTAPVSELQVAGTSGSTQFRAGTATNGYFEINAFDSNPVYCVIGGSNATAGVFGTQSNIPTILFTNNTERMRIDTSGNVGIGTSTPNGRLNISRSTADAFSYPLNFSKSRSGSIVQAEDELGYIGFWGFDGTVERRAAYIIGKVDGTPGSNDMPGRIMFFTKSPGVAAAEVERMRITSAGNIGIGTTSPNASAILDLTSTTQGLLFPRMTTTQRNAISSPAAGLVVYDTDLSTLYVRNASSWSTIGGGALSYTANIGDNSNTTFTVTHSLNTTTVITAVVENSTGYYVYPDVKISTANAVIVEFVSAPTTNQYKVIVLGA